MLHMCAPLRTRCDQQTVPFYHYPHVICNSSWEMGVHVPFCMSTCVSKQHVRDLIAAGQQPSMPFAEINCSDFHHDLTSA